MEAFESEVEDLDLTRVGLALTSNSGAPAARSSLPPDVSLPKFAGRHGGPERGPGLSLESVRLCEALPRPAADPTWISTAPVVPRGRRSRRAPGSDVRVPVRIVVEVARCERGAAVRARFGSQIVACRADRAGRRTFDESQ